VGWRDLGRHVKKGEKAITLCMPVTVKCKGADRKPEPDDDGTPQPLPNSVHSNAEETAPNPTRTCFVYRPHWFVLSQTEGKQYEPAELPQWSEGRALETLKIERVAFQHTDGNAQGYAVGHRVSVSPVAFTPARTLMHELAHVVLGH